jgi:glutamyl/glutaminyl-tRNA synthetase
MLTRLAPTPSGYLHTGNVYNFLLNWLWARSNNGKVLLRIDDSDTERIRKEYVEDIFNVLDWLGIDWDIGPTGPTDLEQNWSQLHRKYLYTAMLDELTAKQLIFSCTCSRKQLETTGCTCSDKYYPLNKPGAVWKIKKTNTTKINCNDKFSGLQTLPLPVSANAYIVKKKNGFAAYQVCSLADDRHFAVTHIARGKDLMESTAIQLYIDSELGNPHLTHCTFWHHHLIKGASGAKLSKSAGIVENSIIKTSSKATLIENFAAWAGIKKTSGITLHDLLQEPPFVQ